MVRRSRIILTPIDATRGQTLHDLHHQLIVLLESQKTPTDPNRDSMEPRKPEGFPSEEFDEPALSVAVVD